MSVSGGRAFQTERQPIQSPEAEHTCHVYGTAKTQVQLQWREWRPVGVREETRKGNIMQDLMRTSVFTLNVMGNLSQILSGMI